METQTYNGEIERVVLSAVIFNDAVLGATMVAYNQTPYLFRSDIANYILKFAVQFYRKHSKAPGTAVLLLPAELQEKDELQAKRVAELLESLEKPKSDNSDRLIEIASNYYDKVQLERIADTIQAKLSRDDVDGGYETLVAGKRISTGTTTGINPITDEEAMKAVYADDTWKSLLEFKSPDSAAFFGDTFSRGAFVVINSPEKCGKSNMLLELALTAVRQGRNVAYFEAGDMSKNQVFRRIYERIARHPRRAGTYRFPKVLQVDDSVYNESAGKLEGGGVHVEYDYVAFDTDMSYELARAASEKWQAILAGKEWAWKFSAHPQDLTISRMTAILDEWERVDGFFPDFVFVDYADLIVSESKNNEFRHMVNAVMTALRGISLARNCCLVTATQANASSWDAAVMTKSTIAEDKRKLSHVTTMLGLNANEYETGLQVARLNYMVRRDDVCIESDCMYIAGCRAISSPMMQSYFPAYRRVVGNVPAGLAEFQDYAPAAESVPASTVSNYEYSPSYESYAASRDRTRGRSR